ncbi:hypothetical protein [Rhodoferax sp.]|uniref:hypothetical protein n=1 Tax=Rhodoferax sp. TaxID=50421 RepID=UPI0027161AD8|nr:hypothetical protein [Rhodoferax sp.]MDO8320833.1 hypothetical protein [Rhodoferax sp.]
MDPLRFRKRRLFRPAALANFVGAYGDSGKPELFARRRQRLVWSSMTLLTAAVLAWGLAGRLPLRLAVTGQVVGPVPDQSPGQSPQTGYFLGRLPKQGQVIQVGQTAHIALGSGPIPMRPGQVVRVGADQQITITLDAQSDTSDSAAPTPGSAVPTPATAWVTAGWQTPFQFLWRHRPW